jgi:flavin-dependent dehydrogenase
LDSTEFPARSWVIPVGPIARSYCARALAVGDAAGQTKPTTGGGIYYGIYSAHCAAHPVAAAFAKSDFSSQCLAGYERQWWQILGKDIKSGSFFRRVSEQLTDSEMDRIFRVARSNRSLLAAAQKLRFDWHSDLISLALKHPLLGWAQRAAPAEIVSYNS